MQILRGVYPEQGNRRPFAAFRLTTMGQDDIQKDFFRSLPETEIQRGEFDVFPIHDSRTLSLGGGC